MLSRLSMSRLPLSAAWLILALSSPAAIRAQTSYTAIELKSPLGYGAYSCDHFNARSLGDNGDVVSLCSYVAGYFFAPEFMGIVPLPYSAFKPVVWRKGSPKLLSLPSGNDGKSFLGVDGQGRVLGNIGPISRPNSSTVAISSNVWWDGTSRTPWTLPAAAQGVDWTFGNVTASGKVAALSSGAAGGTPRLAIIQGSTLQNIPLPPDVVAGAGTLKQVAMNDKGQLAVLNTASEAQGIGGSYKAWFWNGSDWTAITAAPIASYWVSLDNVNNAGQVLLSDRPSYEIQTIYLWSEAAGLSTIDPRGTPTAYGNGPDFLADNGDVVGQATFPDAPDLPLAGRRRASIWRNGQFIDLNTLVKPPSGFVYHQVLKVNAKGQLLVRMTNTDIKSTRPRTWLFTPK